MKSLCSEAVLAAAFALLLAGCAGSPGSGAEGQARVSATLPNDIQISESVPKDVATEKRKYLGVWEGAWGGELDSKFAVEKVTNRGADVVYAWGTAREAGVHQAGHDRAEAVWTSRGLVAEYDGGAKTIMRLDPEADVLRANWYGPQGNTAEGTFRRADRDG